MRTSHIQISRSVLLLGLMTLLPILSEAHVNEDLKGLTGTEIGWTYVKLGFTHILPLGLDHILFVLCLFLLSPDLKKIIWQATAFTIAHSITLALSIYDVFTAPSHIVEPIIALSIFFVAAENIISDKLKPSRIVIVAAFGLIHGMGFASVLHEVGLPEDSFINALITFNIGVEIGQITVILIAWFLVGKWFRHKAWYRQRIVIPASVVIALIALYWTVERSFL